MIIGISGKMGSGKSTIAQMMLNNLKGYKERYFSYKIKEMLSVLTGIAIQDFEKQEVKKQTYLGITIRELLQTLGTQWGRSLDKDFWVKVLLNEYNPEKDNWIITGIRFPNELEAIQKLNGICIRVNNPNIKNSSDCISETALDDYKDFDITINNNGTLEELEKQVKTICYIYE